MAALLTSDDLDGIGYDAARAPDPGRYVAELVDAVDHDRIADPAEIGYALALATEIAELCRDSDEVLALAARRVAVTEGTEEHAVARGDRADLLLRHGRTEEGLRELDALRPRLTRDPAASDWLVDALVENGYAERAEDWLTTACATAVEIAELADADDPDSDDALDAWEVADALMLARREVRHDLGRVPDATDEAAAELLEAMRDGADLVFWPESAFAEVRAALPDGEAALEADWDAHRAAVEGELQAGDAVGDPPVVEVATPELLAAVLAGDRDAVAPGPELVWPPGRNEHCWCGSRVKYKKCCLPRGRG